MADWLFKEEPDHYSYADLVRDGRTVWDGVANALALKYLHQSRAGDRVFFYHTGKEKSVVGEMKVVAAAVDDSGAILVEVEPVKPLARPVALKEIKADEALAGWDLVRLPRLSVVPVTAAQWRRVVALSKAKA
jgi:predicted RNA-binding protein with PUA-like domain